MNKRTKVLVEEVIQLRKKDNDFIRKFAIRNKASPPEVWSKFEPFTKESFNKIFKQEIDGVRLRFRYAILIINGRC